MTTKKLALSVSVSSLFLLSACGGGSTGTTSGQNATGASVSAATPSIQSIFSTSNCLTGKTNLSGSSLWYIGGSIDITNTCSTQQSFSGQSISLTSQDSASPNKLVPLGTFNNWWVNGAAYTLTFVSGGGNVQVGTVAAGSGSAVINANQTITFTGGVNLNGSAYDSVTAAKISINGQAPVVETGTMTISIDTSAAGCTGTLCNNISVAVKDVNGSLVKTITVPVTSAGAVYKQQITDLPVNTYSLQASTVGSDTITYTPSASPSVSANTDTAVSIVYKAPAPVEQTGTVKISLGSYISAYTGTVKVQVLDTKQANAVVYNGSLSQGANVTTAALPVSSTTHAYAVQVQGIADPVAGNYYAESSLPSVAVTANTVSNFNIPLVKSVVTNTLQFNLSGMDSGDKASINFQDSTSKYAYPSYSGVGNGNVNYKFESATNLGYTVQASGTNYASNPIVGTVLVSGNLNIGVTFVKNVTPVTSGKVLSVFWCGFGGDFCGQSTTDDVNPKATHVILAFANTNPDGSVYVDTANWPTALIKNWQAQGKKVIISVGGQNGLWVPIFQNPANFINSVKNIINTYGIDGVDLDIENYETAPQAVALTINQLRAAIGTSKQIIVSPEIVGVYQATTVPSATVGGSAWNYFVPVLKDSINAIDYVQPQFYNNWYGGNGYNASGASADYIVNGYINWMNQVVGMYPTNWGVTTIPNFSGVPANKLVIGVLASTSAGGAAYYATPDMIGTAFNTLQQTYKVQPGGIMMWDSNWDKLNGYAISNKAVSLLGL